MLRMRDSHAKSVTYKSRGVGWTDQSWLFLPLSKDSILRPLARILFAIAALLSITSETSIFFNPKRLKTIL